MAGGPERARIRAQGGPEPNNGEEVMKMATTTEQDREEVLQTTPQALRDQALRRVKKRRDLQTHALVYVLVNCIVWAVWAVVGLSSHSWWPWPVFMTLFWGIGLVMNAWDVYFRRPITEDEVRREIQHLAGRS